MAKRERCRRVLKIEFCRKERYVAKKERDVWSQGRGRSNLNEVTVESGWTRESVLLQLVTPLEALATVLAVAQHLVQMDRFNVLLVSVGGVDKGSVQKI